MASERHIISGYGLCKITVNESDYFFDVISYEFIPEEIQDRDTNLYGTKMNKAVGYDLAWKLLLGTLIPNTDVTPNITKTGKNIYDFLNDYHSMADDEKLFTLVPAYGTEATFNELNNRTSFEVLTAEGKTPHAIAYKMSNLKLGQALVLEAVSKFRISYDEFQYFYRNTSDGVWNNVGTLGNALVRHSDANVDLLFRIGDSKVNANFKTGGITP